MDQKLLFSRLMKAIILSAILCAAASAQTPVLMFENAATAAGGPLAPDSAVSLFGSALATQTATAPGVPLPTTLGGVSIDVTDSANTTRAAGLFFVSPTQINFVLPAGTAPGTAQVRLSGNTNATGM